MKPFLQVLGLIFAIVLSTAKAELSDAEMTLVVYNKNEPASEGIARHYAERRGVPSKNILGLECPNQEEIKRSEFNNTILRPIREFVQTHDLIHFEEVSDLGLSIKTIMATQSNLKYIVLCYGIPLKIAQDPSEPIPEKLKDLRSELLPNAAAVDSDLALLPFPHATITAFVPNKIYKKTFAEVKNWQRLMVCVARLDGPTPEIANKLVDDAVQAEKLGLYGRAFFDMRGIPDSDPGYKMGDDWIRGAKKNFETHGWEVVADEQAAVFGENVDATSCAIYAGWYAGNIEGPFAVSGFRFRTGSIAYHLHSWSASTLRSTTSNWTGPLLAHGAAASLGCVYEPYLQMTPNVDILFQRLLEGCSFGEAAYSCQQFLSWMTTVVGDPLYRPFAISNEDRITQFESRFDTLDPMEKSALAWAYRFKSHQMYKAGNEKEAIKLAYTQADRLQERSLWVGLANLYLLTGDSKRAAEAVKAAVAVTKDPDAKAGTLRFAARTCAQVHDWEASLDYYRELLIAYPRIPDHQALSEEAERAASMSGRQSDVRFFQSLQKK